MQKVRDFIQTFFAQYEIVEEKENFEEYVIIASSNILKINKGIDLPFLLKEDSCTLGVVVSQADIISVRSNSTESEFNDFYNKIEEEYKFNIDEQVKIEINIQKSIDANHLSVYNLNLLEKYFINLSIIDQLRTFSKLLSPSGSIIFNTVGFKDYFYSKSIVFKGIYVDAKTEIDPERKEVLKKQNLICHFENFERIQLSPNDFELTDFPSVPLKRAFEKLRDVLSLICIADISSIEQSVLKIKLNGYKAITAAIDLEKSKKNILKPYFAIFEWVYTGGNLIDKIGIARNIISLHVKNQSSILIEQHTLNSIQSGFKVYEKENLKQYIDIRNNISEQLLSFNERATKISDNFALNFQRSAIALLSFYISTIVFRVLKDENLKGVFNTEATILSIVFLILSFVYYKFAQWEIKEQKLRFVKSYKNLKSRFRDLLDSNDIQVILNNDNDFNEDLSFIESKERNIAKLWRLFLFVLFLTTIILFIKFKFEASNFTLEELFCRVLGFLH